MNPRIRGRLIEIRESLADLLSYPSLNEDIPVVYQTELVRALGTVTLVLDQNNALPPVNSRYSKEVINHATHHNQDQAETRGD